MSRDTLKDVEAAILAHHRDTTDPADKPERFNAVITGWVVVYEFSNLVDVPGESEPVIGFQNEYIASDSSPNLLTGLTVWGGQAISEILDAEDTD